MSSDKLFSVYGKVGMDETPGMRKALEAVLGPVKDALNDKVYWDNIKFEDREYKRRDGFIPYARNHGGLELSLHVPQCESHDWDHFLGFGECNDCSDDGTHCVAEAGDDCRYENDGHLDAFLRTAICYEGIERGRMKFYLYLEGGNNDAPYFRSEHLPTLFETEFSTKGVFDIQRAAAPHIKKLLKLIKGKKNAK